VKIVRISSVVAAVFLFSGAAWAGNVYNACVMAEEPTFEGAQQEAACKCVFERTRDDKALQEEAIALTRMSRADRQAQASPQAQAIMDACFGDNG